ncbi:MAG: tyrosine-type recombinase/integrase [Bacteroidota bacterium]
MLLQSLFDVDIIRDPKLCSIVAYGLVNAKSVKSTQFLCDDEPILLLPFQVAFLYEDIGRFFSMQKEEFLRKIDKLSAKMNVIIERKEHYVLIKFLEFGINVTSLYFIPEQLEGQNITLSQWLDEDIQSFLSNRSSSYLKNTKMIINNFIEFTGDKTVTAITTRDYDRFVQSMREKKSINVTSINDYTRALKACIRRAFKKGYIEKDPFKGLKQLPEKSKQKIIWGKDELYMLLHHDNLPKWMSDAIKLALLTGMRRGEIANLLWENINFEEHVITVTSTEIHDTKFKKTRNIPINREIEGILNVIKTNNRECGIETRFVICDDKGVNIDGGRLQKKLKKITNQLQLRAGLSFHSFRKTYATELRRKGVPQYVISHLLGHASERVTQLYLGVPTDEMVSAMQEIKLIDFQ